MVFIMRKRAANAEVTPPPLADEAGRGPLEQLQDFERMHKLDPNLPVEELNEVDAIVASGNADKGAEAEAALVEEDSPYPEVSKFPSQRRRRAPERLTPSLTRCAPP